VIKRKRVDMRMEKRWFKALDYLGNLERAELINEMFSIQED